MSDQASKSIKIKFEIDQASFDRVTHAIEDLGKQITKINDVGKGLFGGGGMGAIIGGNKSGGGGSGNGPGSRPALGVSADAVAQALSANVKVLKGSADAGRDSLKVITDATKQAVDSQTQYISKLKNELQGLNKAYQNLGVGGKWSETNKVMANVMQEDALNKAGELSKAESALGGMKGAQGPQGFMGKLAAMFGMGGGAGGGGGGAMSALGGMGVPVSSAAVTALALATINKSAAVQNANIDHYLSKDSLAANSLGASGAMYGGLYKSLRQGDLVTARAFERSVASGQFDKLGGYGVDENGLVRSSAYKSQVAREIGRRDGTVPGLISRGMSKVGTLLNGTVNGGGVGNQNDKDIASNEAYMKYPQVVTQDQMNDIQYQKDRGDMQVENQFLQRYQDSMPGMLSIQRSGNRSYLGAARLQASAARNNFDAGSLISAEMSAKSAAGYGYAGNGYSLMRAGMAGMGNAASVLGMGAQYNGGKNQGSQSSLFNAMIGSVGGGSHLEEASGNTLGGTIASQLPNYGNFHGDAASIYSFMSPMVNGGTGGEQQFKAGTLGMGLGMMGKDAAGIDGASKGARWSAIVNGVKAAGINDPDAAMALQSFASNPMNRIDLIKGKLPTALRDAGFTSAQQASDILGKSDNSLLGNVLRTNGKSADQKLLHGIDSGGGFNEYFKTHKMTPEIARELGSMRARYSNGAITEREAEGEFDILGGLAAPGKAVTGGHIRAGGKMSKAQIAAGEKEAGNIMDDATKAAAQDDKLAATIRAQAQHMVTVEQEMTTGIGTVVDGAKTLGTALSNLAKLIHDKFGVDIKPKAEPTEKAGPSKPAHHPQSHEAMKKLF